MDIGIAAERVGPTVGGTVKFTFTSADSGLQDITFHSQAAVGGFAVPNAPLYVMIKTTADVHLLFGQAEELGSAVTNTNAPLFQAVDGWQDFLLMPNWNKFRVKGDSAGGDIYIQKAGR